MNLYLRLLKILLQLPFLRRGGLFDVSRIHFRSWPNDLDLNLHMNNGRYLTLMDLGRIHLLGQQGLLGTVIRRGWQPMLTAAEINFVRAIGPFQRFALVTRLLTWDEKYFYIEQQFLRGSTLCAVASVRGLFLVRGRRVTPAEVLEALAIEATPPQMPALIRHWNDLMEIKKEQGAAR